MDKKPMRLIVFAVALVVAGNVVIAIGAAHANADVQKSYQAYDQATMPPGYSSYQELASDIHKESDKAQETFKRLKDEADTRNAQADVTGR